MEKLINGNYRAMQGVERQLANCSIEKPLRELIKLRVSQINGCAFCLHMHWQVAREAGETEQRLYSVAAWRECPFYTQRERAGLLLAEELTRLADRALADHVHDEVRRVFCEEELNDLVWIIAAINTWNRVNVALKVEPATPQSDRV